MVKATAATIKLCDKLLKEEKQNYVVNAKDLLSLAMEPIMLIGHVNFSMNDMRSGRIKYRIQEYLHSSCEAGNPPNILLLGITSQRSPGSKGFIKTYLTSPISTAAIHTTSKPQRSNQVKNNFLRIIFRATNKKHDIHPQYQNNRKYRNYQTE